MSKQSSIEWLNRWFIDNQEATYEEGKAALKQAKAMHRKEIEDSWLDGVGNWDSEKEAEQYYNEKFNQ